MSIAARIAIGVAVGIVGIQLVPVDRSNPPVSGEIVAPPEIQRLIERSCFDCHSNQTRWPWYSHVAPVSWLVAQDVEEAREHLNFSSWQSLPADERMDVLEEIGEEVEESEMPLWFYLPLHADAQLDDTARDRLVSWAQREAAALRSVQPAAEAQQ